MTSKPTNSEIYLIGKNFLKVRKVDADGDASMDGGGVAGATGGALPTVRISVAHQQPAGGEKFVRAKHHVSIQGRSAGYTSFGCSSGQLFERAFCYTWDVSMAFIFLGSINVSCELRSYPRDHAHFDTRPERPKFGSLRRADLRLPDFVRSMLR